MKGYVYYIEFPDGTVYVGSTTQPVKRRISNHITALKQNRKPVKSLIPAFAKFGWSKVDGCQTFNAVVTSIEVEINTRKELRQHEQRHMGMIPAHKLLNIRHATGAEYQRLHRPHNFMLNPVDCSAWVDLLYPVASKVEKAA